MNPFELRSLESQKRYISEVTWLLPERKDSWSPREETLGVETRVLREREG